MINDMHVKEENIKKVLKDRNPLDLLNTELFSLKPLQRVGIGQTISTLDNKFYILAGAERHCTESVFTQKELQVIYDCPNMRNTPSIGNVVYYIDSEGEITSKLFEGLIAGNMVRTLSTAEQVSREIKEAKLNKVEEKLYSIKQIEDSLKKHAQNIHLHQFMSILEDL